MADVAQTKVNAESKLCRTCSLEIPGAARKCTHCGSYQWGLRKFLGLTQSTLAMMVALVAVTSAALPEYSKYFGRKSSLLSFAGCSANVESFSAFVSNSGDRPGLVTAVELRLGNPRMGPGAVIEYAVAAEGGGAVIEPGKSVLVRFTPVRIRTNGLSDGRPLNSASICSAEIQGQEFNGTEISDRRKFPCWSAMPILSGAYAKGLPIVHAPF